LEQVRPARRFLSIPKQRLIIIMMIQVPAPANSFYRRAVRIKHFQIPIRGIQPGVFAVQAAASPDTQRRLVSYPPNLESAAAPTTAFATSSWPRSGCEMVCPGQPRWCDAQAQRFGLEGDHCAAG
jgi:hypothetical protein